MIAMPILSFFWNVAYPELVPDIRPLVPHLFVFRRAMLRWGAFRLSTLRLTTATHSSRCLEGFHCSNAVSGCWSIATWTNATPSMRMYQLSKFLEVNFSIQTCILSRSFGPEAVHLDTVQMLTATDA